VIRRTPPLAA